MKNAQAKRYNQALDKAGMRERPLVLLDLERLIITWSPYANRIKTYLFERLPSHGGRVVPQQSS